MQSKFFVSQDNEKIFWSPSVRWVKNEECVKIEIFSYKAYTDLFPKFYSLTKDGIYMDELVEKFNDFDSKRLVVFIKDLLKKRILVKSILTPEEIFYPQSILFENKYSKDIVSNEQKLNEFKHIQLTRSKNIDFIKEVKLDDTDLPEFISDRKSIREFSKEKISFEKFSCLLSSFKQRINDNGEVRYFYASAGGLYPIDVYLYIKQDRVENFQQGLYYYDPVSNSVKLVDDVCVIDSSFEYYSNEDINKNSAVTVFLVYNAEANMPKYKSNGYFYALIDAGIMVSTLTNVAELNGMGVCSIGECNFKSIQKYFKLNKNQIYIHSIELGLK